MSYLREHYLDWPHEVSIETFSKCNAACTFCTYPIATRIGEKMPDEMLDRIIEELKDHPWPFMISPFKLNEPLLDKRLIPLCRKINAELPRAVLRIFTNGSALTEKHIKEIATLERVRHLWVSLNDHRPDEYEKVMGLKFERTAANLDALHAAKAMGWFPHEVVLSKVRCDEAGEDEAFWRYCNERWPLFQPFLIKRDGWLGHIDPEDPEVPDTACGRWFELSITATGVVSHCCMDGLAEYPIGDLRTQSLFEVYNSPAWRRNRLKMWSRKNVHPCSTCTYGK